VSGCGDGKWSRRVDRFRGNYQSITTDSGGKGEAKEDWLRGFPALPNGIPRHDTFCRVFARLDPKTFGACVADWMGAV
jgi:hypothetical protein